MAIPKQTTEGKKISDQEKEALLNATQNTDEEHDPDQAWYWTPEWQEMERQADEDILAGRYKTFDTMEELLADLDNGDIDD